MKDKKKPGFSSTGQRALQKESSMCKDLSPWGGKGLVFKELNMGRYGQSEEGIGEIWGCIVTRGEFMQTLLRFIILLYVQ